MNDIFVFISIFIFVVIIMYISIIKCRYETLHNMYKWTDEDWKEIENSKFSHRIMKKIDNKYWQ